VRVIDGEVAQPDPRVTWTCPECGRVRVDEGGELAGVTCSSPGRGVGQHPLRWMVASGRPAVDDMTYVEPARQIRRLQQDLARRAAEADDLAPATHGPIPVNACWLAFVDGKTDKHHRTCGAHPGERWPCRAQR
jgi:hypothetical protein